MPRKAFTNKTAAIIAKDQLVGDSQDVFCPLINSMCVVSCQCFCPPYMHDNAPMDSFRVRTGEPTEWYVYPGYCGNAMFSANREVEIINQQY